MPYESNIVSSEPHGMQHLSNNVVLYTKILAFLAKNLMPQTPPPAAPYRRINTGQPTK